MEKIKKFNLELALFVNELKSYSENVSEIDDETNGLLVEAILGLNQIHNSSKFNETRNTNENRFVQDLNNDIFKCHRYILCNLCHEQISLNSKDFDSHLQTASHKAKEAELKSSRQSQISTSNTGHNSSSSRKSTTFSLTEARVRDFETLPSSSKSVRNIDQKASTSGMSSSVALSPCTLNPQNETNDFENIFMSEQSKRKIVSKMIYLTKRSKTRIENEQQVLSIIRKSLTAIDSRLYVVPFGSSTYGFGGVHTNFNIFINAAASRQNPYQLFTNIEQLFKSKDVFIDIKTIYGNRSQKRHLLMRYKKTNTLCSLHLGMDLELVETSKIIRDYIKHIPICYHLIAYIRSLLITQDSFSFNTYIISVLVIFFLQNYCNCPKRSDLPVTLTKRINIPPQLTNESANYLKYIVVFFFEFWSKLEMGKHLISINVGRLLERKWQPGQSNLTPEQKRLKDGIAKQPANWEDCTMFVQDIKSPGLNITADISRDEVCDFKKMCQFFSTENMHIKLIDEYLSKSLKVALNNIPIALKAADIFRIEDVDKLARLEVMNLLTKTHDREQNENQIVNQLKSHFCSMFNTYNVIVGSSFYGLSGPNTDLNILFIFGLSQNMQWTESSIRFPIQFQFVKLTRANRVQMKQWELVHIKSKIRCTVQFAIEESTLEESSKLISYYMIYSPKCKALTAYVKAWLNAMNDIARKSKLPVCEFNTYIVAILVIFYLQREHNMIKLWDVHSLQISKIRHKLSTPMNELITEFFDFYGYTYEQDDEVISLNIGSWQPIHRKGKQKTYTPYEKRLRDGMRSKPCNWTNCYMWVQDIVSDSTNITAEIPKNAVDMFVANCKYFSALTLESELNKLACTTRGIGDLIKGINFEEMFSILEKRLTDHHLLDEKESLLKRDQYVCSMKYILNKHIKKFNNDLEMVEFGSNVYGNKCPLANFNVFINTGCRRPSDVHSELYEHLRSNLDITNFEYIFNSPESCDNPLEKPQIRLVHTNSEINCFILFDNDNAVLESSSEIIKTYNDKVPMCLTLVKLVRTWQIYLPKKGKLTAFDFNAYIISVLVIFFFQMKYNVPIIDEIDKVNVSRMTGVGEPYDKLLYQFFSFYGNDYKMSSHIINARVGQWMERKSSNSPAQESLGRTIDKNPERRNDCSMYVQDLVREDFNITALVTEKQALNFQQMCQIFAAYLKDQNPFVYQ